MNSLFLPIHNIPQIIDLIFLSSMRIEVIALLTLLSPIALQQQTPFDPNQGKNIQTIPYDEPIYANRSYESDTVWYVYPPDFFNGQVGQYDAFCTNCTYRSASQMINSVPIESYPAAQYGTPSSVAPTDQSTQFGVSYKGDILIQNTTGLYGLSGGKVVKLQEFEHYQPSYDNNFNYQLVDCPLLYNEVKDLNVVSVCYYQSNSPLALEGQEAIFVFYEYDINTMKEGAIYNITSPVVSIQSAQYVNGYVVFFYHDNEHVFNVDVFTEVNNELNKLGGESVKVDDYQPQTAVEKDSHVFNINITTVDNDATFYFGVQAHYEDVLMFAIFKLAPEEGRQVVVDSFDQAFHIAAFVQQYIPNPTNLKYVQAYAVEDVRLDATTGHYIIPYLLVTNLLNVRFDLHIDIANKKISFQVDCPYYIYAPFTPIYGGSASQDIIAQPYYYVENQKTVYLAFGIYQSSNPLLGGTPGNSVCSQKHSGYIINAVYLTNYTFSEPQDVVVEDPLQITVLPTGQIIVNEFYNLGFQLFTLSPGIAVQARFASSGQYEIGLVAKNYAVSNQYPLMAEVNSDSRDEGTSGGMIAFWVIFSLAIAGGLGYGVYYWRKRRMNQGYQPGGGMLQV